MRFGPDTSSVEAYDNLLAAIGKEADGIGRHLVTHWPHVGSAYRGLVIVGQALNGWPDHFPASQFRTARGRAAALRTTRARNTDDEPMKWLKNIPARTSPFWLAARLLVESLEGGSSEDWWTRFAWANLYPVAPWRPGGNPTGVLKEAQDPHVWNLLRATVKMLRARTVVAFVGPFWQPADPADAFQQLRARRRPLLKAGSIDGCTWLVGWHPNGASHRGWGPREYAKRIAAEHQRWQP